MLIRALICAAVLSFVPALVRAETPATQPLEQKLDAILYKLKDTGAIVSARVVDASTGRELYARDADVPFTPASNLKLVSSSVALDLFGADHQFETKAGLIGKDLVIIGTGDPATGDPMILKKYNRTPNDLLDDWADELLKAGVKSVGSIQFFDGAFDDQQTCDRWDLDDMAFWYAAPIAGLNFNDNCIDITVTPSTSGQPATFEVYPVIDPPTEVINTSTTVASKDDEDWDAGRYPVRDVYWVKGKVFKARQENCPVPDPGRFFALALKARFHAKGIDVTGPIVRLSKAPEKFDRELTPIRTQMVDILARVNKNSQNLLAEGLSKAGGREFARQGGHDVPGSWAEGEKAARAFFKKNGIDDSKFVLDDGSGLSHKNKVTTHLLSDLLLTMYRHKDGEVFRNSLGIAGVDGTAHARFKEFPYRVYAKTGYINGVRAYSGYVKTDSGKWVIFSIIYNNIPGKVKPYEALQDEACRELMGVK
ncbi:MAG: D-alanyl-D-alanine carboxypeptidase/D-alanyl-D-alanine-endopeptidase [Tepidisphaeraceae bacterium]